MVLLKVNLGEAPGSPVVTADHLQRLNGFRYPTTQQGHLAEHTALLNQANYP